MIMKTNRFRSKFREFSSILRNEYRHIFHDAGVILIVIGAIFIYSTAYSLAYKNEVLRNVPVAVVDNSHTAQSRQLVRALDATPNLRVAYKSSSLEEAKPAVPRAENQRHHRHSFRLREKNHAQRAGQHLDLRRRQLFFDVQTSLFRRDGSVLYSNSQIEWVRFVAKGAQPGQAAALSNPVQTTIENMYNPYGGYATFIMPAILIVIIQQTLLIGIGMVGGTWRERGLYKTLIPLGEKRLSVIPIVLGKSTAYLSIYCATLLYVMGFHYKVFGYPSNGAAGDVVLFLIPYLLSCTFLGNRALVPVQAARKFPVVAALHIHTVSDAQRRVDSAGVDARQWLFQLGRIIPSSSGVDGFIRIRTMGATLSEVSVQFWTLWILSGLYFILACLGQRGVLFRSKRENRHDEIIRTGKDQPNKQ